MPRDIFEAKAASATQSIRNGSLTVYPGSPIFSSSNKQVSYGADVNLLNKPPVTGLPNASLTGQIGNRNMAISGAYDVRFDDVRYYTASGNL